MYKYIEQLRNGPEHHKRRAALLGSSVITGVIFLAWISVLFPQNTSTIIAENNQAQVPEAVTPVGSFKASMATVYEAAKSLFDSTKKTVTDVNLLDQYSKMKNQVESGQIQLTPVNP